MSEDEKVIEIPSQEDIEHVDMDIGELFENYLKENITSVILIEEQMAMLLTVVAKFQIKPEVAYMHLKIAELVIERAMTEFAPKEARDQFIKSKTDVERIIAHAVKQQLNLHEITSQYTKKSRIEGYQ